MDMIVALEKEEHKSIRVAEPVTESDEGDKDRGERRLLCSVCQYPITSADRRIEVCGAHEHTFANPGGFIHRIGCFSAAPGCITAPGETLEFTWFSGFAWAISGCSMCGGHIGWRYRGSRGGFYGLLLDRLVEKDRAAD